MYCLSYITGRLKRPVFYFGQTKNKCKGKVKY